MMQNGNYVTILELLSESKLPRQTDHKVLLYDTVDRKMELQGEERVLNLIIE